MDSSSTLTPAHVSPWSKHTLENTTPNYRSLDYEGPDDEASDSNESDDSEEIHTHVGLPLPRVYHSSSIVSSPSGDIFIFGGLGGQQDKNDIWAIRTSGDFGLPTKAKEDSTHMGLTARYVPTAGNAPSPRIGHRSVLADDQLIVWGGSTKKGQSYEMVDSRLYLLNITTNRWTKLDIRPAPSARAAYAACLCGSKFMVFGGKDSKGRCLSDLWSFDLRLLKRGTPNWERIKVSPGSQPLPKSMGHAMVAYENKLYVFGGKNDDSYYNPWCFDLAAGAWAELACIGVVPPQRMNHAVALVGGVVYMFGGRSKDGQDIGDTWSFEIGERMWYKLPSMELEPSIRSGHTLATIGRRVLVVGGWKDNQIMPAEDAFVHILDTDLIDYPKYEGKTKLQFTSRATWSGSTAVASTSEGYRHTEAKLLENDDQGAKNISAALKVESKIGDIGVEKSDSAIDGLVSDAPVAPSEAVGPYLAQGITVPATRDTISGTMSVSEILRYLVSHGCRDVSKVLDIAQASDYPVSNGGFGDVYCATLRNGDRVGVKCMRMQTDPTQESRKTLKHAAHELYVWSKCKHPNVIELLGVMLFRDQIAMVSPWVESGNLRRFLSQNPQADRCAMCVQICDGVDYLHKQSVVHGDLKPDNILVSKDQVPKLTDFGNSALAEYTLQFTHSSTAQVMSMRWAAPEIIEGESKATRASDIYALGMVILETITGEIPYAGVKDPAIMFKVLQKILPSRSQTHIPTGIEQADRLWVMLTRCWAHDPSERPKALEVKNLTASITPGSLTSNTS